ncbi:MAG: twin-arginine translocation signal domain-containing protein, partial [Roseibium sp.]
MKNSKGMNATRRDFLKTTAAAGAGLAMPAIVSNSVLASSGEINIMMWSDYLPESFVSGFTDKTGIKINFTGIGSNDEIINKLKATNGEGFDIVSPTVNRNLLWADLGLLQPFDMSKVQLDKVNPAMALGETHW